MYLDVIEAFLSHKIDVNKILAMMRRSKKVRTTDEDNEDYSHCIYWGGEYITPEKFAELLGL